MHRLLRNIHLALAALALPFVLMYGLSSIEMTENKWFRHAPAITQTQVSVSAGSNNPRLLARELMNGAGLRGEVRQITETPAGYKLRIARPGTAYDIDYARASGRASIRTSTANSAGLMNALHNTAGFWHDYGRIHVWSAVVVFVSIAIILLGISGVWMWFGRSQDRMVGFILLALNLGFSLTLLFLIRFPR